MPRKFRGRLGFGLLATLALLVWNSGIAAQTPATSESLPAATGQRTPIRIYADLSEAPRRIFHARLIFPVSPGPMTLEYPEWIPGEHGPTGPITDLVGLRFMAGGKTLTWRRDDVDMYAIHLTIPDGATELSASLDYVTPAEGLGYSSGPSATPKLAVLEWCLLVLYPQGVKSDDLTYAPKLRLPGSWKYGTALETVSQDQDNDGTIEFKPVTLTNLIDSPVIAGEYFRSIPLATEIKPPHRLDVAADSKDALNISKEEQNSYDQLVREAGALFGARHYNHYDFLLALSDHMDDSGLEHHQSSDNRAPERMFLDPVLMLNNADLLSHEFTHSWNGKYRRPEGLATPDYQKPMKTDLLWVYEGLTQYLGEVLGTRSGSQSPEQYREWLAWTAAYLGNWPGRTWRPLEDTAVAAQLLYLVPNRQWRSWRRSVDFYEEGALIWLEADVLIREQTQGKKSLDDFCRMFYGAPSTPPEVVPYNFEEVTTALNQIAPYDWAGFFHDRLDAITLHPPTRGITDGGWQVVFDDKPNAFIQSVEEAENLVIENFTLGIDVTREEGVKNGVLADVIPGGPAAEAGLAPGMKLITVNGRAWSADTLHDAIRAAKGSAEPILLIVENEGFSQTYRVHYHGGERYPHLERDTSKPDLLGQTMQPLAANPAQ
jgi:predicted metalloprotease with PDZ domain